MKNNLGVTMIELALVVVIILIIISFAVMSGRETLDQADITEVYVEMKSMKDALNGIVLKQDMDENFILQQGIHYDMTFSKDPNVTYNSNVTENEEDWYIIFGMDWNEKAVYESSIVKDTLGLDSIKHTYIVNFNEALVELYRPLKVSNIMVRTFEEVRKLADE